MNKYELTTILSEKNDEKGIEAASKSIKKLVEDAEGKIEAEQNIGKKKLTYSIKKNEFGTFLVFQFSSSPDLIKSLKSKLKTEPEIIRFLIIKLPKHIEKKVKKIEKVPVVKEKIKKEVKEEKPTAIKKAKKAVIKKEVPKPKPEIAKEIESEDERMQKLEEELDKILEE